MTVAPGTTREIVLDISAPFEGDAIDILLQGSKVSVSILLPDGSNLRASNADELGFLWQEIPDQEWKQADAFLRKMIVRGPGRHTLVTFRKKLPGGVYRIRVDAREAGVTSRIEVVLIPILDRYMASLRAVAGMQIADPVAVPAGSANTSMIFTVTPATGAFVLDVSIRNAPLEISIRCPDGKIVTKGNAQTNGIEWEVRNWPPEDLVGSDSFGGFVVAFCLYMMLPIEGVHHQVTFEGAAAQTGDYIVQVNATSTERVSEVRLMHAPMQSIIAAAERDLESILSSPEKPSGTTAVAATVDGNHFPQERIDLVIGIKGKPPRGLVRFRSRVTVQPMGSGEQSKPVVAQIRFALRGDGKYHATFTPPADGL